MRPKYLFAAALCLLLCSMQPHHAAAEPNGPAGADETSRRLADAAGAAPADAEPAILSSPAAEPAVDGEAAPLEPARLKGRAPLMIAAQNGDIAAVKALLDGGARVNSRGVNGTTALMDAAFFSGDAEILRALINAGADVNAADKDGLTSLMLAIYANDKTDAAEALLRAGANVGARSESGWTPLMFALRTNKPTLFIDEMLHKYGARAEEHRNARDGTTPMMIAAQYSSDPQLIAMLYEAGAETTRSRNNGDQPLHFAARNVTGNGEAVVRRLLEYRAEIDCRNGAGWTPLMVAAMFSDDADVVKELLNSGATVNARKKDLMTPVMLAGASAAPNAVEIARLLVDSGADLEMTDANGRTPFLVALRSGHSAEMARFLNDTVTESRKRKEESAQMAEPASEAIGIYATMIGLPVEGVPASSGGTTPPASSDRHDAPSDFRALLSEFLKAEAAKNSRSIEDSREEEDVSAASDDVRPASGGTEPATEGKQPEERRQFPRAHHHVTPLMLAAVNPTDAAPDIIAWLIEQGEKLEERDEKGRTALICAVRYNENPNAARALIEAGANTRVTFNGNSLRRLLRFNKRMSARDKKALVSLLRNPSAASKNS